MATMDLINNLVENPRIFSMSVEQRIQVEATFNLILEDEKVKAILVNILEGLLGATGLLRNCRRL